MSRSFTTEQVAENWGVSSKTVQRLIDNGHLRAFDIGRGRHRWRIPQTSIDEYEAGRQNQAPTERKKRFKVQEIL